MKAFQVFRVLTLVLFLGGVFVTTSSKAVTHKECDDRFEKLTEKERELNTNKLNLERCRRDADADERSERDLKVSDKKGCQEIEKDLASKRAKYISTCRDMGGAEGVSGSGKDKTASCSALAEDCNDVRDELKSFDLSGVLSGLPGMQNSPIGGIDGFDEGIEPDTARRCSLYTQDKYESKKKDLESEFNRKTDDLNTAKDKKVDADKDFQKSYAELEKQVQKEKENYEEDKIKKEQADREAEVNRQKDEMSLTKALAEAQSNLIKMRAEKVNLMFEQQALNDQYKSEILTCKINAQADADKTNRRISPGLGGAGSSGGMKNAIIMGRYRTCLANALKLFNIKVASARAAVEDKTLTIQATEVQFQQMQALVATQAQQYQDALKSKAEQTQKGLENYYAKMNQLMTERQRMIKNHEEKRAVIDEKSAKLEAVINQKSNEIKSLVALDPGDRAVTRKETSEALTTYQEARSAYLNNVSCSGREAFIEGIERKSGAN